MFSTHWLLSLTVLLAAMAGNRLAAKEEWEQAEAPPLVSQLVVDRDAKTYGFLAEGARGPGVRNARWGLQVDGKVLWSSDATAADWQGPDDGHVTPAAPASMVLRFDRPKLEWTVRWSMLAENGVGVVSLTIKNLGPESVSLGKCYLADTSEENGLLDLGGNASATVVLASSGWSAPGRVQRVTALHTSRTVAQLYNPTSQTALQAGFLTFDRANTLHQVEWNQARLRPVLRSYCDFEGFALAAGAEMAGETLTLELSRNPLISLTHWADRAAEHYRPRIWQNAPAGWVGWAWVDPFNVKCYEDMVRRNAAAIEKKLAGLGVKYVWVSLGNIGGRTEMPGNWLDWNAVNFPSGRERLVADLRQHGLTLGLWMAPFWLSDYTDPEVRKPLWPALLQLNGQPALACKGWSYGIGRFLPPPQRPKMYGLDPTDPRTEQFLRRVLATYRQWGVRWYMMDFVDSASGSTPGNWPYNGYHDRRLVRGPEVYRRGMRILREAAGEDTYLLASTGPTFQNVGLADAVRTGNDYGDGRPLTRQSGFYPATFVINKPSFWTAYQLTLDGLAANFFIHRKLCLADSASVLTLDKPCPLADAQIAATIFGINGGPMMLGDDVDRMSDERLPLVRKCLPRLPECAVPLDLFETPAPDHPHCFALTCRTAWDQWRLLALFNSGREPLRKTVSFRELGLDPARRCLVWDFWNEQYLGVARDQVSLTVPAGSVKLLRIAPARAHPWLLSTDMHVRQGQAEITACNWDEKTGTLSITASRPTGHRGVVFIWSPPGLEIVEPRGLWIAKDGNDKSLVIRADVQFGAEASAAVKVRFRPLPGAEQ